MLQRCAVALATAACWSISEVTSEMVVSESHHEGAQQPRVLGAAADPALTEARWSDWPVQTELLNDYIAGKPQCFKHNLSRAPHRARDNQNINTI